MPEAMGTFAANHSEAKTDCRRIETVDPADIRRELGIERGSLDVLVGGPPCKGFSINAPSWFLEDPRNVLFKRFPLPSTRDDDAEADIGWGSELRKNST